MCVSAEAGRGGNPKGAVLLSARRWGAGCARHKRTHVTNFNFVSQNQRHVDHLHLKTFWVKNLWEHVTANTTQTPIWLKVSISGLKTSCTVLNALHICTKSKAKFSQISCPSTGQSPIWDSKPNGLEDPGAEQHVVSCLLPDTSSSGSRRRRISQDNGRSVGPAEGPGARRGEEEKMEGC